MQDNALSLADLNIRIKEVITQSFSESYWVVAEISEINTNRNGHCYLELIEKNEDTDTLKAKARATIWAYTFRMLQPYFETTTGQTLTSGLKVLVNVTVEFHELYGYSLNIKDIDPSYTIGDLARKRLEIIKRLEDEGVIDMNKEIILPDLPQKIAIISSNTAAGYGDFINQLENNNYGYKFYHKLFPALMQGDNAEESIVNALDSIYQYEDFFDAVVIIRGGGSKSDLACFNNYWLAYNITQFPLPVLSGIGHERDETIVDLVANTSLKTPTAVAEFLISCFEDVEDKLLDQQNRFINSVTDIISTQKSRIELIYHKFSPTVKNILASRESDLKLMQHKVSDYSNSFIKSAKNNLSRCTSDFKSNVNKTLIRQEERIISYKAGFSLKVKNFMLSKNYRLEIFSNTSKLVDPENILKRGYSITMVNGKSIKSTKDVKKGDIIDTKVYDGIIESTVSKTKQ